MKAKTISEILWSLSLLVFLSGCLEAITDKPLHYEPTRESLSHHEVPEWFRDGKLGIMFHWGPVSAAEGYDGWYARNMYLPNSQRGTFQIHEKKFGPVSTFGFKDLIPLLTTEKFDPAFYTDLFKRSRACVIAAPAAHHDGFAMWNSKLTKWNSVNMGPKRDVVGEMMKIARDAGLKAGVCTHIGRHHTFFPKHPDYDTWNPEYAGLYGSYRKELDHIGYRGTAADAQLWFDKHKELIDNYAPDYIFVDGGIMQLGPNGGTDHFRKVVAYYYNKAMERNQEVLISYKHKVLTPKEAIKDREVSQHYYVCEIQVLPWLVHHAINSQWFYPGENAKKHGIVFDDAPGAWIRFFVDVISKNGHLFMNIGPKADGTMDPREVKVFREMGDWLKVNGEGVYGTRPWRTHGEGEIKWVRKWIPAGKMPADNFPVRFTQKDGNIFAFFFKWPKDGVVAMISIRKDRPLQDGIQKISLLGSGDVKLKWQQDDDALRVQLPEIKPCEYGWCLKIEMNAPAYH